MSAHTQSLLGQLIRLTAPPASDAVLLARWVERRDEGAFAELMGRHGPMVLGVCRRVLGDLHAAEDSFQAVFLVLARKAGRLRRPEALPGFLFGVAVRLAHKARAALVRRRLQPTAALPEPADRQPHALDLLSGRELLAALDEEVARLPEVYRLPVLLCVLQERPVDEAARLLGWSVGSVRGRLARGRERLRQRLARRGLDGSSAGLALLAPASISRELLAAALANLNAPAPAAVAALAARSAPGPAAKAVGVGLLLLAVGLGAGLALAPVPAKQNAAGPAPPPAAAPTAKAEPRLDRSGDPLPPDALTRLGTLRFRLPHEIEALALSPDGKTVAASSSAGVFLFDAASGKRLKRLPGQVVWRPANPLVFSADGKRLIARAAALVKHPGGAQSFKGLVRVWDLAGQDEPRDYECERTVSVGWSATGEPLAAGLTKGAVVLYELAAGRSRRFACDGLTRPELYEYAVCAGSSTGEALAVVEQNRPVIHIWDTASGRERCTFEVKSDGVSALVFTPDGKKLACGVRNGVQLWDLHSAKVLNTVSTKETYPAPAFSKEGKLLVVLDSWRALSFRDALTGRELGRTRSTGILGKHFSLSSDGKAVAAAEYNSGAFHLFDVATGKRKPEPVGHRGRPHGIAFSPDGRRVATGGSLDSTIHVWDLASGASVLSVRNEPHMARDVAFSADGRSLFASWSDDELWVCDAVTGQRQHVIKLEDSARPDTYQSAISMHLSADGKTLVAVSYYYSRKRGGPAVQETLLTGWDTATRKQRFRRRWPGMDSWLAMSDDGRVLAMAGPEGGPELEKAPGRGPMRLEELASGQSLLTFPALAGQTWPLALSPDGRLLAANNFDWRRRNRKGGPAETATNTLRLLEVATAAEVLILPAADQNCTAFSADGRLLAVASPGQEILVWDLLCGREVQRFRGFGAAVTCLAFAPDGRRLVSGLDDATLLVWDVRPRTAAPAHKLGAEGLAQAWADLASPDGRRAFKARGALVLAGTEGLALLKERLRPVQPADAERVRRLLTELGNDQFAVRAKAQGELESLGDLAEPAMRKLLAGTPTLEVRRRVQQALDRLRGPVTRPELLRSLRALGVLEDIGTPAARQVLQRLAGGARASRVTREAQAALERLDRKTPARENG
jgi:RNA polymerase sigma factor (sigma-70 family)